MTDITPVNAAIQAEACQFRRAVSESLAFSFGQAINYALQQIPLLYAAISAGDAALAARFAAFGANGALRLVGQQAVSTISIVPASTTPFLSIANDGSTFLISVLAIGDATPTPLTYPVVRGLGTLNSGIAFASNRIAVVNYEISTGDALIKVFELFTP